DLEFELAEMRQRYTDKHPRVIQRKQEIADLEAQLRSFSGKELEYGRMLREVEVNKRLYGMLKEKLEEARITEAQKVSDVSIVDPAVMPGGPISANKKMTALAGIIMGLILGIAFAFIFETLDTSINTIEDVEKVVKLRVLGLVPPIKRVTKKKSNFFAELKEQIFPSPIKPALDDEPIYLIAHYEPSSTSAEAYRNILTNLKLDKNRKTVIVTSSGPREGKSSIVCNLGIIMAQAGLKTCIVGADLRRPTLDKAFGVKREPGLNELATGSATLKEALNNIVDIIVGDMNFDDIRKTPGLDNLWILPSGHLSYNPAEILKSKEITKVIEELKKRFDVIIFDAPPVLPVTDASLLAPQMDAVVLVYEIGRTSREALIRAKIQLESVGAKITGVILNHTQPETEPVSSYPYYHYKYGYTTKGEVEKRHRTAEEKLAQV
ncbi:MAG: AAA family ATPase, partial [Candidatus Omnitrophica bacterium]|nr:AAA family ATPase [Candidatus Omnitrophota bacterium]